MKLQKNIIKSIPGERVASSEFRLKTKMKEETEEQGRRGWKACSLRQWNGRDAKFDQHNALLRKEQFQGLFGNELSRCLWILFWSNIISDPFQDRNNEDSARDSSDSDDEQMEESTASVAALIWIERLLPVCRLTPFWFYHVRSSQHVSLLLPMSHRDTIILFYMTN